MKYFGYVLIAIGFLSGAFVAVLDEATVLWGYFGAAMLIGAGGVALVHLAKRQLARETEVLQTDIEALEESLEQIVAAIDQLNREKTHVDPYDIRHRIDEMLSDDLATFVEVRESIGHVYGLEAYADVMMHFAAGERYLNRVWSASADGYVEEVHTYLERAGEQFQKTRAQVSRLKSDAGDG